MDRSAIVTDSQIDEALLKFGFTNYDTSEGLLMLTELLVKADAGCHNSYTEELFMKYYVPGQMSQEKFDHVLSLTSIRSEDMIKSMQLHVVKGMGLTNVCWITDVDINNLKRALVKFNGKLTTIEKVKELDWCEDNVTRLG